MFDPAQDPPAALRAGDVIKFVPADGEAPVDEEEVERAAPVPETAWVEVLAPGPMTTVQDIGRHGYARHGVSRSGAADDLALRMGNALVGNDDGAAGLEVTMGGAPDAEESHLLEYIQCSEIFTLRYEKLRTET
jgi:hypothetical protein